MARQDCQISLSTSLRTVEHSWLAVKQTPFLVLVIPPTLHEPPSSPRDFTLIAFSKLSLLCLCFSLSSQWCRKKYAPQAPFRQTPCTKRFHRHWWSRPVQRRPRRCHIPRNWMGSQPYRSNRYRCADFTRVCGWRLLYGSKRWVGWYPRHRHVMAHACCVRWRETTCAACHGPAEALEPPPARRNHCWPGST